MKKICTHNGNFHCDEALACFLLRQTKEFKNAEIVRTRDPAVINEQAIVVDVGGIYDPSKHRYDHHQRGFFETLSNKYPTKLSSAGLVYKHFGKEILHNILSISGDKLETVYDRVYVNFVEGIDGIDNGIDQYPTDIKGKYKITTDLSARVNYLNPAWNDTHQDFDGRFLKAVELTGTEFLERVNYFGNVWLPARSIVEEAVAARFSVDPSGEIVLFNQFCPWREHLNNVEEEQGLGNTIKYVLFGDTGSQWRVQCVPLGSTFENRLSLPEQWRGRRDDELSTISGIDGCVFVHMSGFIGGNKTKEGALEMARKALKTPPVTRVIEI
jgi:uncharacterized UPF0160 family protein